MDMRQQIWHLTETLRQILKVDKDMELQEIYMEIIERIPLTQEQVELTYGVPNFHHSVNKILSTLVEERRVIRVRRGVYRKGRDATSKT